MSTQEKLDLVEGAITLFKQLTRIRPDNYTLANCKIEEFMATVFPDFIYDDIYELRDRLIMQLHAEWKMKQAIIGLRDSHKELDFSSAFEILRTVSLEDIYAN